MKDEILLHLDNPKQLENLYRANKVIFKREFNTLYLDLKGKPLADFWNERLNYETEEITWRGKDILFVIIASIFAGLLAKLPAILQLEEENFYTRNAGFIIFPVLTAWFAWKNKLSVPKIAFIAGATVVGVVFINLLPGTNTTDTVILSSIHMQICLWSVLGFAFVGEKRNNPERRLGYLSYNGDLVVMTTLIMIAAGILSAITNGLFNLIGINIEKFYFQNVVIFGLPAAPILGTYLTQTNPQLVGKVSPVLARIFSPLVLIMLVIYLVAIVYSGKDPYNDREFLMIFNVLLIGVMAIIFFSVAGTSKTGKTQLEILILLLLSVVTIIVNGIALSAILFRISEWGLTPNRAAVLGGNVLVLINLLLVTAQLLKAVSKKADVTGVGKAIAFFLPVYCAWAAVVTFLFPFLFGSK